MTLQPVFGEYDINQFTLMFRNHQINLEPGFQRRSVWTASDRRSLIQSIIAGYPLPSVFLYKRTTPKGKLIYDVIDGKQRLETILMFTRTGRFKRDWFEVKLDLGDGYDWYDWRYICKHFIKQRAAFQSYKIQTVEVTGDLAQIIDLFVRINSTGKRLTSPEKRHARFYNSRFLKEAERLVKKYHKYLRDQRIFSQGQLNRMKGTELFSELLMSIHKGGPINKKTALDRSIGNDNINAHTLGRLVREFVKTINRTKRMFPNLKQTRFHNSVEFYTLFLLIWEMEKDKFVLANKKKNKLAFEILRKLSTGVDELRLQLKKVRPGKSAQQLYADYLLTVRADTDSSMNRERRRQLLKSLLYSIYERKDAKRIFTPEQRRIVWNRTDKRVCAKCKRILKWNDFNVDHVIAHVKGGRTRLGNAQLMCKKCNIKKGAK